MTIPLADTGTRNIIGAVKDYGKQLFGFIRKRVNSDEDAEDILQDVWYRFTRVINTEPIEQVSAWLFRVARNTIIDQYRKQHPSSFSEFILPGDEEEEFSLAEIFSVGDPAPETLVLSDMFWQELFKALNELPEEQRMVFIWNELDEISFEEIARKTGEKINTLISRKRYAVLHLRKRLRHLHSEIIQH
jgi:RNA polymerase sigma factor (sigma-70 family)